MPEVVPAAPVEPAAPRRFEFPAITEPQVEEPKAEGEPNAQNKEEQAPSAASDGDPPKQEAPTPEQAAKRESRRFERRLDKAYRKAAEAEARAALLEKQLNEVRQPKQEADPSAPRMEQFNDIEEYAAAKAEHEKQKALKELQAQQSAEQGKAQQARLMAQWEEKVAEAEDEYDDFHEVVGDLKPVNHLVAAVMEAGPKVAYFLGKNAAEAKRIAALPALTQIREIGKIEARLEAEAVKPKAPSKAPAPIAPLTGAAGVARGSISDGNLSFEEFKALREKQLGRK